MIAIALSPLPDTRSPDRIADQPVEAAQDGIAGCLRWPSLHRTTPAAEGDKTAVLEPAA